MLTIPPHSLVLGFAFSMTPEGLPGTYNEHLANQLRSVLRDAAQRPASERPWIGMQWEIFDALEATWNSSQGDLLELVPLMHVAAPPVFVDDDIVNAPLIVEHLRDARDDLQAIQLGNKPCAPSTVAGRALAARIDRSLPPNTSRMAIAACFNSLLPDGCFHCHFYNSAGRPLVELHDLYRSKSGSVGVENRVLPSAEACLLRFQRLRVNRLIIEAIFPNERVLKPGRYLSTQGVLAQLFEVARTEAAASFEHVFIYGHPAHSPRCRRQFLESDWARQQGIPEDRVYDACAGMKSDWEATTAQMCCRSQENWDDYERMHKAQWD